MPNGPHPLTPPQTHTHTHTVSLPLSLVLSISLSLTHTRTLLRAFSPFPSTPLSLACALPGWSIWVSHTLASFALTASVSGSQSTPFNCSAHPTHISRNAVHAVFYFCVQACNQLKKVCTLSPACANCDSSCNNAYGGCNGNDCSTMTGPDLKTCV